MANYAERLAEAAAQHSEKCNCSVCLRARAARVTPSTLTDAEQFKADQEQFRTAVITLREFPLPRLEHQEDN